MSTSASTVRGRTYRIPPSKYWAHYWYSRQVGAIASLQLVATFGTISMEAGNAVVDIFRSNVYAGFWSFPFMVVTILATYACGKRTNIVFFLSSFHLNFSLCNTNTNQSNSCANLSINFNNHSFNSHWIFNCFYCNKFYSLFGRSMFSTVINTIFFIRLSYT